MVKIEAKIICSPLTVVTLYIYIKRKPNGGIFKEIKLTKSEIAQSVCFAHVQTRAVTEKHIEYLCNVIR